MIVEQVKALPVNKLTDNEVEAEFRRMMHRMQAHERARPKSMTQPERVTPDVEDLRISSV